MIATAELDLSQHPDIETILISTVYFPHLRAFFARCGVCLCTRSLKLSPRQIPFHCVCSQEIPDNFSIFNCSLTPPDQSNPSTIFLLSFHVPQPPSNIIVIITPYLVPSCPISLLKAYRVDRPDPMPNSLETIAIQFALSPILSVQTDSSVRRFPHHHIIISSEGLL